MHEESSNMYLVRSCRPRKVRRKLVLFLSGLLVTAVLYSLWSKAFCETHRRKRSKAYRRYNATGCVKRVHVFADMKLLGHVDELRHFKYMFQSTDAVDFESDVDCVSLKYKCDIRMTLGADVKMIKGKDVVVFGMIGTQWRRNNLLPEVLKTKPEPEQTWIYYSTEPPYRITRWSETLNVTALKYHILMTYDSRSDIHIPFGYYKPFDEANAVPRDAGFLQDELPPRTGLMAWVASNCRDIFWPRMDFVSRLKELLPMDTYGTCGEKECLPKRSEVCSKLMASYKFFLAIPNSECRDYITEKFWNIALKHGTVPVVVGAPWDDYAKVAPPNSFVHFAKFDGFEQLGEHLRRADADDAVYRRYHDWRTRGEVVITYPIKPVEFCRALPHIHVWRANELKSLGDSPWYNGCREIPSKNYLKPIAFELESWSGWK